MTFPQISDTDPRRWQALVWATLLGYFLFSGMKYAKNILLVQAYGGWSPMDWVAHQLMPENFNADFPSGIAAYRMSSFMQLYLVAARLGVDLELLIPGVICFEVIFLGISAAFLFRVLMPKSSYVTMVIFALLVVEGSVRDMDIARFAGGFYRGLFYNVADGLRLLGLAFLFRGQIVPSAVLLGISFTVHPVMAGMACAFAIPYILDIWDRFSLREWSGAGAAFLLITGAWLVLRFQSAGVASGGIAPDSWTALVRMFSFHWFPVDIGVFTRLHKQYVLPLLCLISLTALYLPCVIRSRAERIGIGWGLFILVVLTCTGVLISEFSLEPFLIKLALHRTSNLLILLSLLIVVAGLVGEALSGRVFEAALGGALLLSPLVNIPYIFPLMPTVILVSFHTWRARCDGELGRFYISLAFLLILMVTVFSYYLGGIAQTPAYMGGGTFWRISGAFLAVYFLRLVWDKVGLPSVVVKSLLHAILLVVVLVLCMNSVERKTAMSLEKKEMYADYLAAQRWARDNTAPQALFMVDPTIYYGWRDFSQRSSFGNLREWLHTSWLYDSRVAVYEEGCRRFAEFGIAIEPYKRIRPSINGFYRLSDDIREIFYLKDQNWFEDLSSRYKVNYVVFQKKFVIKKLFLKKAFENSSFVIYRFNN